ncbi:MAG: hypothetical protein IJF37_06970 [Lachnospiraceae bacterium]|nr:hypothetical protein [Lachnospiraceae bacterium]
MRRTYLKRIMAIIMSMLLLFTYIPINSVLGDVVNEELTTKKFVVKVYNSENKVIDNASFEIEGNKVAAVAKEEGVYELSVKLETHKETTIDIYGDSEHYYERYVGQLKVTANSGNEHSVVLILQKNVPLGNSNLTFDSEKRQYSGTITYAEDKMFILKTPENIQCEVTSKGEDGEANASVSKVDKANDWKIDYMVPGTVTVKLSGSGYKDTYVQLYIKNDLRYEYENNKNINGLNVSKNQEGHVENVEVNAIPDGLEWRLNLTCPYPDSVEYTSANPEIVDIKSDENGKKDGTIVIKSSGETTITASCKLSGISTSYDIKVNGYSGEIVLKDSNGKKVSKDYEFVFDAVKSIGTSFSVIGEADTKLYNISYASGNDNIATVDQKGNVTIKGVGNTDITVTAVPLEVNSWVNQVSTSYKIKVEKGKVSANISYKEKELTPGGLAEFYDCKERCDVVKDEKTGNGISLTLPFDIKVYDMEGKEVTSYTFQMWDPKKILKFDGNIISNPDEIVRNRKFEVNVQILDDLGRFDSVSIPVGVILYGNVTNNRGYYTISGVDEGADGERWNTAGDVKITGNSDEATNTYYDVALKNIYSAYGDLCIYATSDGETTDTEHKIFVRDKDENIIICREYFGVDKNCPEIMEIQYDEGTILTNHGIYSVDAVEITVMLNDKEENLYDATLSVEGKNSITSNILKTSDGKEYCVFKLDGEQYNGENRNVKICVRDRAGNSVIEEIGNIVIEDMPAIATFSIDSDSEYKVYESDNKIWTGGDVKVNAVVTDLVSGADAGEASGLLSYEVHVNGVYIETVSFEEMTEKVLSDTYVIDTALYSKTEEGLVTIQIKNIKDFAGNSGVNGEYKIYVDTGAPTAEFVDTDTKGNESRTAFGNFYNSPTGFVFKPKDDGSGVHSVTMNIDDVVYNGSLDEDGIITFSVNVMTSGDMYLTITDNVENVQKISLSSICDGSGKHPFSSDYVLLENNKIKAAFEKTGEAFKGEWYRDTVTYIVNLKDEGTEKLPASGIKNVKVFVNDTEYGIYDCSDKYTVDSSYKITIDKSWIEKVISESGIYTVKVIAEDNAGNITEATDRVKIDMVAPVISDITGVENGSNNTGIITVNFQVMEKHFSEEGNKTVVTVKKTLDGKVTEYEAEPFAYYSVNTKQAYTFSEDGTYVVTITSEDAAGNKAEPKTISFIVDNTAPIAEISGVTPNEYYMDKASVKIDVVESNYENTDVVIGITRELNGVEEMVQSKQFDGTQKESSLVQEFTEEGTYTIKVDAKDKAGNVALTKTVIFTIDTYMPVIEINGVENGAAYNDEIVPSISIKDNFYRDCSVNIVKTGVYFNGNKTDVNSFIEMDVTSLLVSHRNIDEQGAEIKLDSFNAVQENDGIYTLVVTATDYAGRTSTETISFSVNRFGSVYTFDENLKNIVNTYNMSIDNDFVITEYNANRILADSVKVTITRDGSLLNSVVMETYEENGGESVGDSGWYQYRYVISKDNFKYDGVYVISVSSADEAGNNSNTITYDEMAVRFSVDTTKPEVVKVMGLSKDSYSSDRIRVEYEAFDAVAIEEVRVFLNGNVIQTVTEFSDVTTYRGEFYIEEGMEQKVRFAIEDKAGNVIDTDNMEDMKLGKVVDFCDVVTVSTDMFVRWYVNKPLFYGTIIGTSTAVAGGVVCLIIRRKRIRAK